jgi:hypothetical protein
VLIPEDLDARYAGADAIRAHPEHAIEWQLMSAGVHGVFSVAVPLIEPATRFWVGLSENAAPTSAQRRALAGVAHAGAAVLNAPVTPEQSPEQLRRLELAAALLPALLRVLDVREVFDRLSIISRAALPHDMLTLGLFSDDLATMTMYARSGQSSDIGRVFPQPYPPSITQAWEFDIIDDRAAYPLERDRPPTRLGMRSSLRLPFKFEGRIIGGLGFHAYAPSRYGSTDVAIGRRLADHVAVALFHHKLAEQARHNEELRARATSIELLDELLATLIDSGDLRDVFERVPGSPAKVLPHDATALLLRLSDDHHYWAYASRGFSTTSPSIADVPAELLEEHEWEQDRPRPRPSPRQDLARGPTTAGRVSLAWKRERTPQHPRARRDSLRRRPDHDGAPRVQRSCCAGHAFDPFASIGPSLIGRQSPHDGAGHDRAGASDRALQ